MSWDSTKLEKPVYFALVSNQQQAKETKWKRYDKKSYNQITDTVACIFSQSFPPAYKVYFPVMLMKCWTRWCLSVYHQCPEQAGIPQKVRSSINTILNFIVKRKLWLILYENIYEQYIIVYSGIMYWVITIVSVITAEQAELAAAVIVEGVPRALDQGLDPWSFCRTCSATAWTAYSWTWPTPWWRLCSSM